MRTFYYQIFIIIFVALSLFIVRDDVVIVYNKTVSYIKDYLNKTDAIPPETAFIKIDDAKLPTVKNEKTSNDKPSSKSAQTPGPLKVSSNLLSAESSDVKLSQKGIISLTNEMRKNNGDIAQLKENSKLDFSAEKKLQDMFMKQYFDHKSPDGLGIGDLANQISYEYIIIGENLAQGNFKDNKSLVDAWMASPGHRANILNKHYSEIGVAIGKGMYNDKETWMAVTHFGLPRTACPKIDEVLHGVIIFDQKQAKSMEDELALRREKIDSGVLYENLTTNEQIDKYNILVVGYNQLIETIKQKILEYNTQVKAFNACVVNNT